MQALKIRIAWNWGTEAQRTRLLEKAAGMVADVLKKHPLIKSVTVEKKEEDCPEDSDAVLS